MEKNNRFSEDEEFDEFIFKIQQFAMKKLWDNKEDEIWNEYLKEK